MVERESPRNRGEHAVAVSPLVDILDSVHRSFAPVVDGEVATYIP